MRLAAILLVSVASVVTVACGSTDPNQSKSGTGTSSLASVQCSWPASLDDGGPGGCTAARALVSCTFSGGGCGCTSDGPLECGGGCGSETGASCSDGCAANEYVVACGGIGPNAGGANAEPPSACHFVSAVPAGIAYYCCPCE
jgi:hypothetical protein